MPDAKVNPYVGPRPFTRNQASLFFGRERETNELVALIISHPTVLLYSQSGAGKSSLLSAGILPLLQQRGSQVLGPVRVGGRLPVNLSLDAVGNVFALSTLLFLHPDDLNPERFAHTSLAEFLGGSAPLAKQGSGHQRVLILDQFEEIFTAYQERWPDRAAFFEDLGQALESDPHLRVLFAMREEYIGRMDPFVAHLPERLRTRFRLERLREDAALAAVERPLVGTGRCFAPTAARKLVNNLRLIPVRQEAETKTIAGEFVEPVHLQLVCEPLWSALPAEVKEIGEDYVENYGDVDEALGSYYEKCIQEVMKDYSIKEGVIRSWFENALITPLRTRGTAFKDADSTVGLSNKAALALQNKYMIRPEVRGGAEWYELTHDRFIAPIVRSNQKWRNERSRGSINSAELESRAAEWHTRGEPDSLLLSDSELNKAVGWLASTEGEELGASEHLRDLLRASQKAAMDRKVHDNRRLQAQRIVLAVLCVIAAVSAYVAIQARSVAIQAKSETQRKLREQGGQFASALAKQPGNAFQALVQGILAVAGEDHGKESPPKDALAGLRAALDAVGVGGSPPWIRTKDKINGVTLSRNGKRLAVISDHGIVVWDKGARRAITLDADSARQQTAVAISDDGDALCVSEETRTEVSGRAEGVHMHGHVTCWSSLEKERIRREIKSEALALKFLPNSHRVLLTGQRELKIVNADTPEGSAVNVIRPKPAENQMQFFAYLGESRLFLAARPIDTTSGLNNEFVPPPPPSSLWDISVNPARLIPADLNIGRAATYSLFSPDWKRFVVISAKGSADHGNIREWDAASGARLLDLPCKGCDRIVAARMLKTGALVAVVLPERESSRPVEPPQELSVQVFGEALRPVNSWPLPLSSVSFICNISEDGIVTLSELKDGVLNISRLDAQRGTRLKAINIEHISGSLRAVDSNSDLLVVDATDRALRIYDLTTSVEPVDGGHVPDLLRAACKRIGPEDEGKTPEVKAACQWH